MPGCRRRRVWCTYTCRYVWGASGSASVGKCWSAAVKGLQWLQWGMWRGAQAVHICCIVPILVVALQASSRTLENSARRGGPWMSCGLCSHRPQVPALMVLGVPAASVVRIHVERMRVWLISHLKGTRCAPFGLAETYYSIESAVWPNSVDGAKLERLSFEPWLRRRLGASTVLSHGIVVLAFHAAPSYDYVCASTATNSGPSTAAEVQASCDIGAKISSKP